MTKDLYISFNLLMQQHKHTSTMLSDWIILEFQHKQN